MIVLKTNVAQLTDVEILDSGGIIIPNSGGSITILDLESIREISNSLNILAYSTDFAFGASSTIILNDGTTDVLEANVESFLSTIVLSNLGPYSVPHRDNNGILTIDHNSLTNLVVGDPHTQYSPIDGSRDFTAPVGGVDPVNPEHLATKSYVESLSGGLGFLIFTTDGGLIYDSNGDILLKGTS